MALWALVPDKEGDVERPGKLRLGVFLTTAVAFFVAEIGDKTQIATAAHAARFHDVLLVAAGTMLRIVAALAYLGLGLWGLAPAAGWVR